MKSDKTPCLLIRCSRVGLWGASRATAWPSSAGRAPPASPSLPRLGPEGRSEPRAHTLRMTLRAPLVRTLGRPRRPLSSTACRAFGADAVYTWPSQEVRRERPLVSDAVSSPDIGACGGNGGAPAHAPFTQERTHEASLKLGVGAPVLGGTATGGFCILTFYPAPLEPAEHLLITVPDARHTCSAASAAGLQPATASDAEPRRFRQTKPEFGRFGPTLVETSPTLVETSPRLVAPKLGQSPRTRADLIEAGTTMAETALALAHVAGIKPDRHNFTAGRVSACAQCRCDQLRREHPFPGLSSLGTARSWPRPPRFGFEPPRARRLRPTSSRTRPVHDANEFQERA